MDSAAPFEYNFMFHKHKLCKIESRSFNWSLLSRRSAKISRRDIRNRKFDRLKNEISGIKILKGHASPFFFESRQHFSNFVATCFAFKNHHFLYHLPLSHKECLVSNREHKTQKAFKRNLWSVLLGWPEISH